MGAVQGPPEPSLVSCAWKRNGQTCRLRCVDLQNEAPPEAARVCHTLGSECGTARCGLLRAPTPWQSAVTASRGSAPLPFVSLFHTWGPIQSGCSSRPCECPGWGWGLKRAPLTRCPVTPGGCPHTLTHVGVFPLSSELSFVSSVLWSAHPPCCAFPSLGPPVFRACLCLSPPTSCRQSAGVAHTSLCCRGAGP